MSPVQVVGADDASALYAILVRDICRVLPGQAEATYQALAVLGVRHAVGTDMVRGLVLADSNVDVSRATAVIARTLGYPHVILSLGLLSGEGWQGRSLSDSLLDTCSGSTCGDKAVVTLTDVDALKVERGEYSGVNGTNRRWGEDLARAVEPLLAGRPIMGGSREMNARSLLVVAVAEGVGLPETPSTGDWIDWSVPAAVARHLAVAPPIRVVAPDGPDLVLALTHALAGERELFDQIGYRLDVAPAAVTYAVRRLELGDYGGMSAAVGWLKAAAHAGLATLLREESPEGTTYTITPDSLRILKPPRGRWIE